MRTAAPSLMTTLAIMLIVTSNANAEIAWQNSLRAAHSQAQNEGKLLLLHFYTDNCTWCDRLEAGAFKAPQVGDAIGQHFVPVKINAASSPKLAEMFKVSKFPTDVIVTTDGKTLSHAVSPQDPDRYVAMLASSSQSPPAEAASPTATIAASEPTNAPVVEAKPAAGKPPVPGYAAAASPTIQDQSQTTTVEPTADLTLPPSGLSGGGVKARFAGSRSEGLTLEMPDQITTPEITASIAATVTDSPAPQSVQEPATPQRAVEDPELAMQGFCPVTVIRDDKWVEGKPEFGVIHLGKLYLFANAENMKMFLANPVPYTPVLNEIDVVRFFEERKIVPGKREWGLKDPVYNRMFFFADEAAMNHFYNEYERYTDAAIEVMNKAVKDANPGS